jgi:hypothetical protein
MLILSPDNNGFVLGTAFEALFLIKNLIFVVDSPEERMLIKHSFLDLFLSQSPFVLTYLAEFAHHISLQMPSSPYDFEPHYIEKLVLMGSYIKRGRFFNSYETFFNQELRMHEFAPFRCICGYFPEFFDFHIEPPAVPTYKMMLPPLDPEYAHPDSIAPFRLFTRQYVYIAKRFPVLGSTALLAPHSGD